MITIITGTTHTGKTLLAQRLLKRHNCPYLSIDHLKMGLIRSGQTTLTPYDDNELTGYLWGIVKEMIKTAIENKQSLIVEGCYVPFDWRKSFDNEYLQHIRFICLAMSDDYIDKNLEAIKAHGSDIEVRLYGDEELSAGELKESNRAVIKGFMQAGEEITLIENDYEDTVSSLLEQTKINTAGIKTIRATHTYQQAGAYYVRIQGMAKQHGITLEREFDEYDTPDTKYILLTDNDFPIATCRFYPLDEQSAMIGRLVVLPEYRGSGLGSRTISDCESWLKDLGYTRAVIESRDVTVGFYKKLGYTIADKSIIHGVTFNCIRMEKAL